jgi:hypothetical protein
MTTTLLDSSATLARLHIDELRRDAAKDRLARAARRERRERRRRVTIHLGLRPAAVR